MSVSVNGQLLDRLRLFLRQGQPLVQLRVLLLLGIGWLLSPLCWWNDLVINLPLAWAFARLLQLVDPDWFVPGLVIGYWLSNVLGIVLMQSGALEVFQSAEARPDRRRELLIGLATATAYTLLVALLVHLGILQTPLLQASAPGGPA